MFGIPQHLGTCDSGYWSQNLQRRKATTASESEERGAYPTLWYDSCHDGRDFSPSSCTATLLASTASVLPPRFRISRSQVLEIGRDLLRTGQGLFLISGHDLRRLGISLTRA